MFNYNSIVNIPAYNSLSNGLIVQLTLTATTNNTFIINTHGVVANALQKNFKRIITIMSSLQPSWHCLELISYVITCHSNHFIVKDSKSSSMALCIALINLCREMHGLKQIHGLTGTGILRIDGSFDNSHLIDQKYFAAQQTELNKFFTPNDCKNLFELEEVINSFY